MLYTEVSARASGQPAEAGSNSVDGTAMRARGQIRILAKLSKFNNASSSDPIARWSTRQLEVLRTYYRAGIIQLGQERKTGTRHVDRMCA